MAGSRTRSRRPSNGVRPRGGKAVASAERLVAHEQIADVQRARILSAMVQESCERGAGEVSVAHVVERSGVSRRTFYDAFEDREACFLAAFEQVLELARSRVIAAVEEQRQWRERIRAGLVAALTFIEEQPRFGRLLIRESLFGSNARVLQRREQVLSEITAAVDSGRTQSHGSAGTTYLTSEGVVGAVAAVLSARVAAAEPGQMLDLTNELMSMIVLPYMGAAAARRELSRPLPAPVSATDAVEPELPFGRFKANGMRLTYRTVRALLAIAERPGSSNRLIGASAGMSDQGQISKLLCRLERNGLIANRAVDPGNGMANAWALTDQGQALIESVGQVHVGERQS